MNLQSDTDWDSVTVLKKKAPTRGQMRSQQEVNKAMRTGAEIETNKKYAAGSNKQHATVKNTSHLDAESEELKHNTVGLDIGRLIQQGRHAKEMTQKDLATRINEKPSIINDYESGKAVLNNQILGKIERAIGIKLRGQGKGEPLPVKEKPGTSAGPSANGAGAKK